VAQPVVLAVSVDQARLAAPAVSAAREARARSRMPAVPSEIILPVSFNQILMRRLLSPQMAAVREAVVQAAQVVLAQSEELAVHTL
jgi:hypothetical protein